MTSLRTQTAYFRKLRLRSQANIDQHYPKKCLYRGNIIQYLQVAEKKWKEIMKIAGVLHSTIIKAQNHFLSQKGYELFQIKLTKEPSVKSTTPPGLEPGIFWSEVRRLIH